MKTKTWMVLSALVGMAVFLTSQAVSAEGISPEEKEKMRVAALAELSGTEWTIQMTSMDGKQRKQEDVLTFENGKINSAAAGKNGYSTSNITVTIDDSGRAIWETMQSAEGKGPIFWRGELENKNVRGVMSIQKEDGTADAYSFNGAQSGTFEAAPVEAMKIIEAPVFEEPPPVAEPEVPVEEAVSEDVEGSVEEAAAVIEEKAAETEVPVEAPKKKKGWF